MSLTPPEDADAEDGEITLTAAAMGYTGDTATVTITDDETGTITLTLDPTSLPEEGGAQTVAVSVALNIDEALTGDEAVTVTASLNGIPLVSATVTVVGTGSTPAGDGLTASGELAITSNQDPDLMDKTVMVTATSGTYGAGMATLTLQDNDIGTIALMANPTSVMEGATTDVVVTVTTSNPAASSSAPVMVTLTPSAHGSPVTINLTGATGTGTLSLSPPEDSDADHGEITVTATATRYADATATVTITDDDATGPQVTITTNMEEIRENVGARSVVVTATLDAPAPAGGVTVEVTAEVMQDEAVATATVTADIVIPAGSDNNSVTVSLNPSDDQVFTTRTIRVTGRADGYQAGSKDIKVVDNDASIGTLSITVASPPSITAGSSATTVTLTVKGALKDKELSAGSVIATLTASNNTGSFKLQDTEDDDENPVVGASTNMLTVSMKDNADKVPDTVAPDGTAKIELVLSAADVATAGANITVTASADMYDSGSRVITVLGRGGLDIQGYRAVLVKPAANGWANVNNHQVEVDVMRVGSVAYSWSQFESIKVSVRDTAHDNTATPHEIDAVTASNFNIGDDGTVTFDEAGSRGDVVWKGNDTIRFRIKINARGSRDPAADGHYLGAYAHVEFVSGSTTQSFTNRDSDKPVYPSNPTLVDEANRYRGDGKLFKVDNLKPLNTAIAAVRVTSGSGDDEVVGGAIDANVGDEIRVAVNVSGNVLFRESGLRIQLLALNNSGTHPGGISYPAAKINVVAATKTFTAAQVIAAANDSLRHTWKITEGFFKLKTKDYITDIGPVNTTFQPDRARAQVRVAIKDQANNWSVNAPAARFASGNTFDADSRSPSVTIRYPAADPDSIYGHTHPLRFTGHTEDNEYGYNDFLNPLVVEVDEDLSKLEVFAVGADTLDLAFNSGDVGDSTVVYDTTELSSPKKDGEGDKDKYPGAYVPSSANIAGTDIELAVLATDRLGNTTKTTISGVTHDAARPEIKEWFPKTRLLGDDKQFNDATPPVFTLPEDVDSIAVRFTAAGGADVTKERGGVTTKGEDSIDFSGALTDETSYEMTIFVRDLAGNVSITPADSSSGMRFNAEFDNPIATRYTFEAGMDSVIAGQANTLMIQAEDYDAASDSKRNALTYKEHGADQCLGYRRWCCRVRVV